MKTFAISQFLYVKHIHESELREIHRSYDHGDLIILSENTFYF